MMRRSLLALACLLIWASSAQAAWVCSTGSVVNIQAGVVSATAVLPTDAPANATKWALFINRSNTTNVLTAVASTADATGWVASPNSPQTIGSTINYVYYKVGAAAGADTVTGTWDGVINTQTVTGWCEDDASGDAQTFQGEATITTITSSTAWVSNTLALSASGGIIGLMASSSTWASVTPNSGETYASGNAAGVRAFAFTKASGVATVGMDVTAGTSSTGAIWILGFHNPGAGTTCTGGLTLLGAGKCE